MRNGNKQHHLSRTSEYHAYYGMLSRCYNKNNPAYYMYGGRGITVCERWIFSVLNFIEDMGKKPSLRHSLDRINNNGIYEQSNCRWATRTEQEFNKRPQGAIKFYGVTFNKRRKKYLAQIWINNTNKTKTIGCYNNPIDAALAYDSVIVEYHGENAKFNFPELQLKTK